LGIWTIGQFSQFSIPVVPQHLHQALCRSHASKHQFCDVMMSIDLPSVIRATIAIRLIPDIDLALAGRVTLRASIPCRRNQERDQFLAIDPPQVEC
jgi:hypothetical protein